jgi:cell division septation protein DedD
LLALLAIFTVASSDALIASDTSRQRQKAHAQDRSAQPPATPAPQQSTTESQPAEKPVITIPGPTAVVVDNREASGVLGREVRSAAGENMGRIVDMIVDQNGQVRAAIIDFGGFLGVGSRKIAVDWKALKFAPGQERNRVQLELTREQVQPTPEYQEGKPIFILSALGTEPLRVTTGSAGR